MFFKRKQKKKWGLLFKIKLLIWTLCFLSVLPVINWIYHVVRNPSQVLSPFHHALAKTPTDTWKNYRESFVANSTNIMTPEFLAALAQTESAGNPVAQPYWRWDLKSNPFEIYAPASSSSGLFQMTEGTFEDGKKFCIHHGKVVTVGPWYKPNSCWFNSLYSRLSPTDSIQMTSARLHYWTEKVIGEAKVSLQKAQDTAAVIHLCGVKKAQRFLQVGAKGLGSCGDHNVAAYVGRVKQLTQRFVLISKGNRGASDKVEAKAGL